MNTNETDIKSKTGMDVPDFRHTGMNLCYFFVAVTTAWILWMELRACDFDQGFLYSLGQCIGLTLLSLLPLLPLFALLWCVFFFVKKSRAVHIYSMVTLVIYVTMIISYFYAITAALLADGSFSWLAYLAGPLQIQLMAIVLSAIFGAVYLIAKRTSHYKSTEKHKHGVA